MARSATRGRRRTRAARRLASALSRRGVGVGDTVAVMLPNTPAMFEAHFGVPMCGAVLNTLNTRLDARSHRLHARARRSQGADHRPRVLADDRQALAQLGASPLVIDVDDAEYAGRRRGSATIDYEAFLADGRSRVRVAAAGRRMGCDRAQLHLGHDRQPEGRRLPPPRRVPQRASATSSTWGMPQHCGVPVDAADVPLQRLVLPVDDGGATPARTSACARSRRRRSSS